MIVAVDAGCAVGAAALLACAAAMFAVTTWPAYVLGVLRVSARTRTRIQGAVVRTSLVLVVAAIAGALFLALRGC